MIPENEKFEVIKEDLKHFNSVEEYIEDLKKAKSNQKKEVLWQKTQD